MSKETEDKSAKPTDHERQATKRELLLAFIEYGSRPTAFVLIAVLILAGFLAVKQPLFELLGRTNELKLGEWIHLKAETAGVSTELQKLASLTKQQIQLFLIVGTKRPGYQITYNGPESKEENYKALESAGLLENIEIERNPDTGKRDLSWKVTAQGERLHALLMEQVISAIEKSK